MERAIEGNDSATAIEEPRWHELANLADVRQIVSSTTWLWPGYLPRGHVSIVAGSAGIGKSLVILDLVNRMLEGSQWPDEVPCKKLDFVMWADTEGTQALLCDRAQGLGIPPESIVFPFPKNDPLGDLRLDDHSTWEMFKSAVETYKPPVVIVDSLCGAHVGDEDSAKTMTKVLGKLQRLARDVNCLMLTAHHIRKKGAEFQADITLDDLRGSSAIAANARTVYAIEPCKVDEPEGTRRFKTLKSNLSIYGDTLAFETDETRVMWVSTPEVDEQKTERSKARDFLRDILKSGPRLIEDIKAHADNLNIKFMTLRRAKKDLDVRSRKRSDGKFEWVLPG